MPRKAKSKALKKARNPQGKSFARGVPTYSGPSAREKYREARLIRDVPKQIVASADPDSPSYAFLPLDALRIIFSYIAQDYSLVSVLSYVCKRWRACALMSVKKVDVNTLLRATLAFTLLPTVTDVAITSNLTNKQQQCTCMAARLLTSLRTLAITYTGCGCLLPILKSNALSLTTLDLTLWHNPARKSYPVELFEFVTESGFLPQLCHLSINLPPHNIRTATDDSHSLNFHGNSRVPTKKGLTTPDIALAESFLAFIARHGTQLRSLAIRTLVLDPGVMQAFFQDAFLPTLTSLDVSHRYLLYPFVSTSPELREMHVYRGFFNNNDSAHPLLSVPLTTSLCIRVPPYGADARDRMDRLCSVATRVTSLHILCPSESVPLERFWMPHAPRLRHLHIPVHLSISMSSLNSIGHCSSLTSLHIECDNKAALRVAGKHIFPHLHTLQVTFEGDPTVDTLCSVITNFQRACPSIRTIKSSVGRITTKKRMQELEEVLLDAQASGLEHLSLTCGQSSLSRLQILKRLFSWMRVDIVCDEDILSSDEDDSSDDEDDASEEEEEEEEEELGEEEVDSDY